MKAFRWPRVARVGANRYRFVPRQPLWNKATTVRLGEPADVWLEKNGRELARRRFAPGLHLMFAHSLWLPQDVYTVVSQAQCQVETLALVEPAMVATITKGEVAAVERVLDRPICYVKGHFAETRSRTVAEGFLEFPPGMLTLRELTVDTPGLAKAQFALDGRPVAEQSVAPGHEGSLSFRLDMAYPQCLGCAITYKVWGLPDSLSKAAAAADGDVAERAAAVLASDAEPISQPVDPVPLDIRYTAFVRE